MQRELEKGFTDCEFSQTARFQTSLDNAQWFKDVCPPLRWRTGQDAMYAEQPLLGVLCTNLRGCIVFKDVSHRVTLKINAKVF